MKKKLIRSSVIVLSVAVLLMVGLSALLITLTNRSNAEAEAKSKLAIFVESWKKYGDAEELVRIPEGADYRLTVVAAEDGAGVVRGQVLADSARPAAEMDNHWEREEIQSAAAGEDRTFLRYSETLHTDMLYFARAAESETAGKAIVRIAIPASRYNAYFVSYLSFSVAAILLVATELLHELCGALLGDAELAGHDSTFLGAVRLLGGQRPRSVRFPLGGHAVEHADQGESGRAFAQPDYFMRTVARGQGRDRVAPHHPHNCPSIGSAANYLRQRTGNLLPSTGFDKDTRTLGRIRVNGRPRACEKRVRGSRMLRRGRR